MGASEPGWQRRFLQPVRAGAPASGGWLHVSHWSADRQMRVDLWYSEGSGAVRFEAFGPPELIAAADWLSEQAVLDDVLPSASEVAARLDLPRDAAGAVVVVEDAFRQLAARLRQVPDPE